MLNLNEIDLKYWVLCKMLLNARKVGNTRELLDVKIKFDNIEDNVVSIRNISPAYLAGELLWYYTGRNDTQFISKFSSFWSNISDNGSTNNSAYGFLMMSAFGFDQIKLVIDMLKKDPNSRRAVINLNTPNPNAITTKDEPCTIALQFIVRDGKVHATGMMRSNDIWFGFPYDIVFFTDFQKYIANRLGLGYGTYTHFVTSMHLYDKDYEKVKKIVENPTSHKIYLDHKGFHEHLYESEYLVLHSQFPKHDLIEFLTDRKVLRIEN